MAKKALPFFLLLFLYTPLQAQIITTVAGNGVPGYAGDGGPALDAALGEMYYVYPAFDNAGNMYIAQRSNNTIRKIDISGIITTIAGTNQVNGYSGDGGPAVDATLDWPTSIAIDNNNNIYFADQKNSLIRKIDAAGIITTVSGPYSYNCGVGDGGPLSLAGFNRISGLTFDQFNNLYISDYICHTVRKVSNAGIVSTVAGNGTIGFSGDGGPGNQARLNYPNKVAIDSAGNIYIPDFHNQRIRKVTPMGIISTFAGTGTYGYSGDGGPALNAEIGFPGSIVIDDAGNFYYGDYHNVIRKIDHSGIISTYAGSGTRGYSGDGGRAILADLSIGESRLSIYNNDIYFVNYLYGNVIRKIAACLTASIVEQPSSVTVCSSGEAVFTIHAVNANGYQWQLNTGTGWTDVTENATYSGTASNTLYISGATTVMNHYQYRCYVTNQCDPVYSTPGLLTIASPANPFISIATSSINICAGEPVNFKTETENGGSNPIYQWTKNGVNAGTGQDVFIDNTLLNEDVITCTLTSDANCLLNNTANSNSIVITVTRKVTPALTISASANNICSGTPVIFTSKVTNAGSSPTFTWYNNGEQLPEPASAYTTNSLDDGDVITCLMTSNLTCVTDFETSSEPIAMTVIPNLIPAVTITSSVNASCRNLPVTFTAVSDNEGVNPKYQWLKNERTVGGNNFSYTDDHLVNGDVITCVFTSNSPCSSTSTVTSNPLSILIHPDPIVYLDKTNTLCEGSTRLLDAGNFTSYLWNSGSTNKTLTISKTGIYSITVTDKNGCTGTDSTTIYTLLASPKNFLPEDTSICHYGDLLLKPNAGFSTYLWNTGSNNSYLAITQPGKYWLQVKDNKGCTGTDSIQVLQKKCLEGFFIPNAFTPNNDGLNDFMKPIILGKVIQYQFSIYNRWGQRIFHTTDLSKGWEGNNKQKQIEGNVFTWICSFQFEGQPPEVKRGSFMLLK